MFKSLFITIGFTALLQGAHAQDTDSKRPPNIIFFLADDLGYGELGCYGQKKILTPHIDALAEQGMKFTQFYSGQAVCAPTRCSFITGQHMGHAIIRNNRGGGVDKGQMPLPKGVTSVAKILQQKGYSTGCVGKWGLGHNDDSGKPSRQGFDFFFGYLCQMHAHHYYPTYLWKNDEKVEYQGNEIYKGDTFSGNEIANEAMGFIKKNKDKPFFLYYATPIPHVSLQIPEKDLAQYKGKWEEKPFVSGAVKKWQAKGSQGVLHYTGHPQPRAAYAAMISHMDRNVGKLTELLEELDLTRDTIFIFTSDNGATFTGGVDRKFFDSMGGLKGHKCMLSEGGIRVPFIVKWPAQVKPNMVSDHVAAIWDMLPTFCEAASADIPEGIDGISMLPTLTGKEQKKHDYLYWEYSSKGGQQALRKGDWKFMRTQILKGDSKYALYDLKEDPAESTNLAESNPELLKEFKELAKKARTQSKAFKFKGLDGK